MKSWISTPAVSELLDSLYADAAQNDHAAHRAHEAALAAAAATASDATFADIPSANISATVAPAQAPGGAQAYMAVGREFGRLLYNLGRTTNARTIVEFGTSFGVSAIHLASALRDNGGGKLITAEFHPEKAARAQRNIAAAGLADFVEIRTGDALQTLASDIGEIDMVFLDGAKELYIDVLKLLEPRLRPGAIIASDNTDHDNMEADIAV